MLAHEAEDLLPVFRAGEDVDLVHHEHDLLAPLADLLQEAALALGEWPVGGGDEEDEVGAGDEVAGELLVPPDDRVGPGRVHDVDLAQQLGRMGALQQVGLEELLGDLGPVAEEVDPVGGGGDPFREHALAEQGVDEARFAGVELAGHDQEEETGELLARLAEAAEVVGLRRRRRSGRAPRRGARAAPARGSGGPVPAPIGSGGGPAVCRSPGAPWVEFDPARGCRSGATKLPCCQHRGLPGLPKLDCYQKGRRCRWPSFSLLPLYY